MWPKATGNFESHQYVYRSKVSEALKGTYPVETPRAEPSNILGFTHLCFTHLTTTLHSVKLPVKLLQRSWNPGTSRYGMCGQNRNLDLGKNFDIPELAPSTSIISARFHGELSFLPPWGWIPNLACYNDSYFHQIFSLFLTNTGSLSPYPHWRHSWAFFPEVHHWVIIETHIYPNPCCSNYFVSTATGNKLPFSI